MSAATCKTDAGAKKEPVSDTPIILTRIYIRENGDLTVTDMWDEVRRLLKNINQDLDSQEQMP